MSEFPNIINLFLVTTEKWDFLNLLTRVERAESLVILLCRVGSMIILSPFILCQNYLQL